MALNQIEIIDKIEILTQTGQLQIRQQNQIQDSEKNNEVIASSFTRWTLSPGDSLDNQTDQVKTIANIIWTSAVISEWQAQSATTTPTTGA